MKLVLIGLCFIGLAAAIGKHQKIQVSGKIQCCSRKHISEPDPQKPVPRPQRIGGQTEQQQGIDTWNVDDFSPNDVDCIDGKGTKGGKGIKGGDCEPKKQQQQQQQKIQTQKVQDRQDEQKTKWVQGRDKRAVQLDCVPPYKAEISITDDSKFWPNKGLKTVQIGNGESEYLIDWEGERVLTVTPTIKALVYCEEKQQVPYEKEEDWTEKGKGEETIEQDFNINV